MKKIYLLTACALVATSCNAAENASVPGHAAQERARRGRPHSRGHGIRRMTPGSLAAADLEESFGFSTNPRYAPMIGEHEGLLVEMSMEVDAALKQALLDRLNGLRLIIAGRVMSDTSANRQRYVYFEAHPFVKEVLDSGIAQTSPTFNAARLMRVQLARAGCFMRVGEATTLLEQILADSSGATDAQRAQARELMPAIVRDDQNLI